MAGCPYTWVRGLFGSKPAAPGEPAKNLMVRVTRDGEERVSVALPAQSARWLIELMPDDVVEKVRAEDIPVDAIMVDLQEQGELYPRPIFSLDEPNRKVEVWLE
ncbi:MAG: hypothetical protein IPF87_12750 [Gemmatimonadetes bacterium]|jgi:hypothetical protein|nr:hypothetical protein [Gemmatimonadota bacterium]MCC7323988.1 hypothetical protein [Gemmatimonadaceae bacterium]MBK6456922.1 hypothetical protein [Gemmatimonadota bacterium]MBK7831589.1 hypothetical protein [Gemmatimonadota bacterium]MBK8059788.1 hypothetical protein [Gemmatimonadota bacterium]